ncbi:FMN-binding negative transcriptional regulator [Nonomuraea turcica]|uniref:FMN-binding negative transcriptional regulator n=1 Tax=Nonomuraea sp. G32 TaxID=3067274 RepID=UPI00273AA6CC|nr:FMN-binding negative transcriptional regulator [Nonomuraea sp. G32]MDP4501312.1 FMN-binding negative transcriptional regulator [Nonomuraea sp. G32]
MRHNADYLLDDDRRIRALVRDNPWATLVSATSRSGLIGSHLPILLENGPGLSVVGHLGRPDEELHELGEHEVLLIVAGPHGYISPGWYGGAVAVPTYNYLVAHLYGRPEILGPEEAFQVLTDTVDRFEGAMTSPHKVDDDYARRVAKGVAAFRVRATRVVAKAKLSQDKPAETAHRVIHALEGHNPELAGEMRKVWTPEESK